MKKSKKIIFKLDTEEKALSDSIDRGEWESVENVEEEKVKARKAASRYLNNKQRMRERE